MTDPQANGYPGNNVIFMAYINGGISGLYSPAC